jgi:hypothetical protein
MCAEFTVNFENIAWRIFLFAWSISCKRVEADFAVRFYGS